MKNLYTLALVLLCTLVGKAQIINFPDANFKNRLIHSIGHLEDSDNDGEIDTWISDIDTNQNGEVEINEALSVTYLNLNQYIIDPFETTYYPIISNLEGISYFTNLTYLSADNNSLISLDVSALVNLNQLNCEHNQLTNLNINGLINLQKLNCGSNQLTSLNLNGLTSLTNLNCFFNHIPSLNFIGLSNLQELDFSSNLVNSVNLSNLSNLQKLNCGGNQLLTLDLSNLANLQEFRCNYNQLSSLDLSNLANLQTVNCDYNQLSSLELSSLANLQTMNCDHNQLSNLNLSGCISLNKLSCADNQLSILNCDENINLQKLNCSHNLISNINLYGLTNLKDLNCSYNLLTNLDASSLVQLNNINCSFNLLTILNIKNGRNDGFGNYPGSFIEGNPLQFICADDFQISQIQNIITSFNMINCHVNSYCSFTPGGTFYSIQGINHFDINNNGCDTNDIDFPNLKLVFTNGTATVNLIPNTSGNYHYDVQASTQTITPLLENSNYFNVYPFSATVTFPTTASPFAQDFCVTANGVHPDLEVVLIPISGARPGFDTVYKLYYKNKGNTTQSGYISLTFNDAVLDLVSANPSVSTQALNTLTWNFSNLVPLATGEIVFTLNVNSPMETPAVIGGDVLPFMANINPTSGDETTSDNTFAFNQTVVNSFDPNDKVCLEGDNIAPEKVGDYVHYIIRFENDGSANAENIVVKDMIDTTKFDLATLIPESGSATYTTRITNTNQVEFVFQNINLPFAAGTNTGYVAFKIKTKPTLVLGNTFSNTASIYFDYNFPIITNTASTTIQALATQDFEFSNYFTLYPNPAKNVLNINTKSSIEVHSITIYNQLGQVVLAIPNAKNLNSVDVSSLKTGNYFLKITSDKGSATEKFLKE